MAIAAIRTTLKAYAAIVLDPSTGKPYGSAAALTNDILKLFVIANADGMAVADVPRKNAALIWWLLYIAPRLQGDRDPVAMCLFTPLEIAQMAGGKLWLSPAEASHLLGYASANALREAMRRGTLRIPFTARGRYIYFSVSAVADCHNAREQAALDDLSKALPPPTDTIADQEARRRLMEYGDAVTRQARKDYNAGKTFAPASVGQTKAQLIKEAAAQMLAREKRKPRNPSTVKNPRSARGGLDW